MKITHFLNVKEIIIEERNKNGDFRIYANGHRSIQFILIIPIIGNIYALIWWLSSFGKSYEYNPKDKKIIYKSI